MCLHRHRQTELPDACQPAILLALFKPTVRVVIVLVAALLVVFMGFVVLAVDVVEAQSRDIMSLLPAQAEV